MGRRDLLTRSLALLGALFVWLPLLAPLGFSAALLVNTHGLRFDYLMPAELFPAVLVGGFALLWAARRARSRWKLIGWSYALAIGMLVSGQLLAVATGLASGETEPAGWPWAAVAASLAGYSLSVLALGIGGMVLLADLLRQRDTPSDGR